MSVIRYIDCYQGHPVPKTVRRATGPFPAELYVSPVVNGYENPYDEVEEVEWLVCVDCDERVRSDETQYHECEE